MSISEYTAENPDLTGFNIAAISELAAFPDGSGGGLQELSWNLKRLSELQQRINALQAFAQKYQLILARLSWSAHEARPHPTRKEGLENDRCVYVPEITLCEYAYDRKQVSAKAVAALWPDAQWRRSLPHYSHLKDIVRDYTADIDCVLVRITNAEKAPVEVKPKSLFPPCGPVSL